MATDKKGAAMSSVFAAVFLTVMKTIVGVLTGSLGIISEAMHSALDLCAALITFFAVKFSDKPADSQHHYGHGKIESFSALIETVLLFITCGWIIVEAVEKIFMGKKVELIGIHWGILIMVVSIIVDISRVKVLKEAAKEHGSQALEADALHFSSDIWSSSVVIIGLICVWIGDTYQIPALKYADPIAALGVAVLVIKVSIKLGKETIDVLLDTAPKGMREMIEREIAQINGVLQVAEVRIRPSGAIQYIDINVGIDPYRKHAFVHNIVHEIRSKISEKVPRSDIVISTFPIEAAGVTAGDIVNALDKIIDQVPNCDNVHDVHVYEIEGKKKITAHIELMENLTLKESHDLSHRISQMIQDQLTDVDNVSIYFERAERTVQREDITEAHHGMVEQIKNIVNKTIDHLDCHDIKLYSNGKDISTFLHCGMRGEYTIDSLEALAKRLKIELKSNIVQLDHVYIHFEPLEEAT